MNLITCITTFCFIAYEISKMAMMKTRWNSTVNGQRNQLILVIEVLYLIFVFGLFFTPHWFAGISLLAISSVVAYKLSGVFMDRKKFDNRIRKYLIADSVLSLIVLSVIIIKELILK